MNKVLVGFLVAAFALGGQTPPAERQTNPTPTLDEVKSLIKNATTPEDHLKLAAFFRQEEAQQMAAAKIHDGLSEVYQFSKAPVPSVADMQKHCEDFALAARNAASAARAMATYHEEMAELIRKSR